MWVQERGRLGMLFPNRMIVHIPLSSQLVAEATWHEAGTHHWDLVQSLSYPITSYSRYHRYKSRSLKPQSISSYSF